MHATGSPYTVFGYKGKQVRDNIHSPDLVAAFDAFYRAPRPAAVYNIGGGRYSNCSMLEAIEICEQIADRKLDWEMGEERGSATIAGGSPTMRRSRRDYPDWKLRYGAEDILREISSRTSSAGP